MDIHSLITSLSDGMGICPPKTLCESTCGLISELSLKNISFLTYVAHKHESGQLADTKFISIVNDWEKEFNLSFNSREVPYKLRNFYFAVIVGKRKPSELPGFRCAGISVVKNLAETEQN